MRSITIQPTSVKDLKPDDLFRGGGQTYRIADLEHNEEVIEIAYYIGVGDLVNYFCLSPDDTLDKVVNVKEN